MMEFVTMWLDHENFMYFMNDESFVGYGIRNLGQYQVSIDKSLINQTEILPNGELGFCVIYNNSLDSDLESLVFEDDE